MRASCVPELDFIFTLAHREAQGNPHTSVAIIACRTAAVIAADSKIRCRHSIFA
jgi:hypothetical protein